MNTPNTGSITAPPPLPRPPEAVPGLARAFGGVWRLTYPRFFTVGQCLTLAGLLAGLALISLIFDRHRSSPLFTSLWIIKLYLTILVPIMSFVLGASAIREDMQPGTVDYLFTRPVSRAAHVVFRFFSHVVCVQIHTLLALGVLAAIGVARDIPGITTALPAIALAQVLCVCVFSAAGFFAGTVSARYLVLGVLYGGLVEAGLRNVPAVQEISMRQHLIAMLQPFQRGMESAVEAESPWFTATLILSLSATLIFISAIVFNRRELAGEKQKDA